MVARKHEARVVTAKHRADLSTSETLYGVHILRVKLLARIGKGPVMPTFALHVWKEAKDVELLHLWLPQFDAGPAALAAWLRGRPIIITYVCSMTGHDLTGKIATLFCGFSHLVAGLLADRIVANTKDYASQSRFCRLFRRKLCFIDLPTPNWPDQITPYSKPEEPYRIGFVGRISPEKSIDDLIEAMTILQQQGGPEFRLDLVGPIEPSMQPKVHAWECDGICFKGKVSDAELDDFYRCIDVLVLPSNNRIEAFGLVQVEAMTRGTPCVAADRPGMRQPVLRTGFGQLFEPGNPVSLAEAIRDLLSDGPPKIPASRELNDAFGARAIMDKYEDLYADIIGGGRKKRSV